MPARNWRISSSVASWPLAARVSRSCWMVMMPVRSVSIWRQMTESSAISFSVRWCARTLSATFFRRERPTKFLRRPASWSPLRRRLRWWGTTVSSSSSPPPRGVGLAAAGFFGWALSMVKVLPGSVSALATIQGSLRASAAVRRFMGSRSRRPRMNSLAAREMSSQSSLGKLRLVNPFLTRSKMATSESPLKGGYPQRRM
mmetsp:Transcript_4579/g.11787  ORF Transcript_4579/g.11787 Transcript_4579/m.11787 type:complete len:200 (+) Transcript_4579:711-1310(+)